MRYQSKPGEAPMFGFLAFDGRMTRLPYALGSLCVLLGQHVVTALVFKLQGWPLPLDWPFVLTPLRWVAFRGGLSTFALLLALVGVLMVAWLLAVLAFRRAADADISCWIAVFAMAPVVQIPTILYLSVVPSRPASTVPSVRDQDKPEWIAAAQGVFAGITLTLFAVAVGALLFGSYGYGVFVVAPFVIGATTGYFVNRGYDLGGWATAKWVAIANLLGAIALVAVALEGIVCIVMAAPLEIVLALIGGQLGRAIARSARSSPRQTLSGVAVLPLVFAVETALPASTQFETSATIAVSASADTVWRSLVRIDLTDAPPALPFRLGVAYPVRGEVIGEGVGAIRVGEFSTGISRQRVTEWVPGRKLAFVVLDDIPAMQELSPHTHVHAPHVTGYFRTRQTSFELVPRADGGTDIIERTAHELRLEPLPYWLPLARWVVAVNNARVLAHIKRHAERNAARDR
jgi:uncharacterized membrane protein YhaH (DUF805 family)